LGIDEPAIANGLRTTTWPARFERVRGHPPIVLDGAHNGASAEALARTLRQERGGRRLVLVIGINRDKDARAVIKPLARVSAAVIVTRSSSPRAADPIDVARVAARVARIPVTTAADPPAALGAARRTAGAEGLV
ncbi:MAG TPA: bifunctional folylpolyglutamate synthase/dihydrofolate synthase, partial [Chloroflexi bacterium]|nr:bifunctional folylpolyglutamate synthase/dihydrofolate synthase [Chloroflexota bacterium]